MLRGVTAWNIAFGIKMEDMLRTIKAQTETKMIDRIVQRSQTGASSQDHFEECERRKA